MAQNTIKSDTFKKIIDGLVIFVAVGLALFHLYSASLGVMPSYMQTSIHWAFVGTFILLTKPLTFKGGRFIDFILIGLNIFVCMYLIRLQEIFVQQAGVYTQMDVIAGIIALILAIEISRRVIGKILPIIAILFIVYVGVGPKLPGMLKTVNFSLTRVSAYLYTASDGIFGQTLYVSAQYIFLFVLFGTILNLTGAGKFFVDIAFSLTGRIKGGPAQAAVYSSMLMGTINGSGAANVVTTGTFTIPLMKKSGFDPAFSGAVEAVASNGGQIMPPVMGAVAFLMAEITGISYGNIIMAALPTAILYYLTLSASVYVTAGKDDIKAIPKDQLLDPKQVMKEGWIFLIPLIVLIGFLVSGYSAQRSGFYAIVASLVVGFIKNREEMTLKNLVNAMVDAARGIAPIAAACILAGVVMGVLNLTGLGLKISSLIVSLAGGNSLIALFLAMITSLILGMGLPTSAAYMVLAILVAPALVEMGISLIAAHLFILYFGALSTITPPVALSTFAAAGIAGADVWETGLKAMKLAASGFIIPFIFAYAPEFLLSGSLGSIAVVLVTATVGCLFLAVSLSGWFMHDLNMIQRIILFIGSIMLLLPNLLVSLAGLIVSVVIIMLNIKQKNVAQTAI